MLLAMTGYWTVAIPPPPPGVIGTPWHADQAFGVCVRGAFASENEAIRWARERLGGLPYSLRWCPGVEDLELAPV